MRKFLFDYIKLALFIFFVFIIIFVKENHKSNDKKKRDTLVKMSIYNSGSTGIKAFKTLLENQGFNIIPITEELPSVITENKLKHITSNRYSEPSTLVITSNSITKKNVERINKLAEFGFLIYIFNNSQSDIKLILGEETQFYSPEQNELDRIYISEDKYNLFNNTEYFVSRDSLRIINNNDIIASDNNGGFLIEKTIGSGRIILSLISDILFNDNIGKYDNIHGSYLPISFFSKNQAIYFFEYDHGIKKRYSIFYLFSNKQYRPFIFSLLILIIGIFLSNNTHIGNYHYDKTDENEIRYFSEYLGNLISKRKFIPYIREDIKSSSQKILGTEKTDAIFKNENIADIKKHIEKEISGRNK